ncbi:hypothetical protein DSO57_1006333 [Entomophthora muscae]|uniref:Uncharacterized protein n=1 Tax=Entomophthora muscae TaxID=34485 RepID=A0ACC2U5C5_9FUNG|nr:hypothetical protein DSO57_1006333 [Entomophthora muscae]
MQRLKGHHWPELRSDRVLKDRAANLAGFSTNFARFTDGELYRVIWAESLKRALETSGYKIQTPKIE